MEGNGNSYSCTKCRFTVEDYHCLDIKKNHDTFKEQLCVNIHKFCFACNKYD